MSEEAIFVAIGIACVVAVLLFIVFIIYCVKKQQDKAQDRQTRQRRAREERHRRHLMRANIVQPPPYDPNRRNVIPSNRTEIPFSPPPEYKEVATPLATHRNPTRYGDVNYTSNNGYSSHPDSTSTLTGNTAHVATVTVDANDFNDNSYTTGNSSSIARINNNNNNSGSYINRNTITTTRNGHVSSSISQIQPQNVSTEGRDLMSRSSSSYSVNTNHSYEGNSQVPSVNERQRNVHRVVTQELSAAALIRQQNANMSLPVNTISSAKPPGDSRLHQSYSRNIGSSFSNSTNNRSNNSLLGAGRNPNQKEIKTVGEVQTDRSNSSRGALSGTTPVVLLPRNLHDVNVGAVTPVHNSNRGVPSRDGPTRQNAGHVSKSDRISGLKELSLI